jgi:predicted RNA methylase
VNVEWLASQEGRNAIESLRGVDPLQARSALPGVDADLVSQALTQAQHRPVDFPLALVTRDGIQQASPVAVARRRATRLAEAGVTSVIEAGCGIGLDSWAFAGAGLHVVAVEVDPTTAAVARANLAGFDVEVRTGDATSMALPPGVLFVDPARRREHADADGRALRIHDPAQWRPSWDWVLAQSRERQVVARIRPGHRELPEDSEWHCTSMDRRLVDATVWFGDLAVADRAASVHDRSGWHELQGPPAEIEVGDVGAYIVDPDPAIVRSGLVSNAARLAGGHLLDPHLAFITCDEQPPSWLGRAMRVLEPVPVKRTAAACRRLGLPGVTVWSRGFGQPPRVDVAQSQRAILVVAALGPQRRGHAWIGLPVG